MLHSAFNFLNEPIVVFLHTGKSINFDRNIPLNSLLLLRDLENYIILYIYIYIRYFVYKSLTYYLNCQEMMSQKEIVLGAFTVRLNVCSFELFNPRNI